MTVAGSKKFYGWWIVAGGFILFFFGIGLAINTVGIFIEEVVSTLHFKRGDFSLFFSIAAITMMLGAIVVGKLIEKIDIRLIMGVGTVLFTLGILLYSQCRTLAQFYSVSLLLGIGSAGTHVIPVTTMINNWFVKKRGLAMGIVFAGTGIGGLVLNPFVTWLIERNFLNMEFGWQGAYIISGIIAGIFIIPTALFVMKKTPAEMGQFPDGIEGQEVEEASGEGLTVGESVKTSMFWFVAIMALLFSVVNMGINQHLFPYLNADVGFSKGVAAMVVGSYLGMTVLGKVTIGALSDRKGLAFSVSLFVAIVLAGIAVLTKVNVLWLAVVFVVVFGFGNVIQTVVPPLMAAHCFGLKQYGLIYGIISIFMTIGSGIGTPLSGYIRDNTGSYHGAFYLYMGLLATGLIIALLALKQAEKRIEIEATAYSDVN